MTIPPSAFGLQSWHAAPGERLVVREMAPAAYGSRQFTFECWLEWCPLPDGAAPRQNLAELDQPGWHWRLELDAQGGLRFECTAHGESVSARAAPVVDGLIAGQWYHLALVFFDRTFTRDAYSEDYVCVNLYLTEQGRWLPRLLFHRTGFSMPPPPASQGGTIGIGDPAGAARIHCASLCGYAKPPADFAALGGGLLPPGLTAEASFEDASLGRIFTDEMGRVIFSERPLHDHQNYFYSFKLKGTAGRELTWINYNGQNMMAVAFISEDGGSTWVRPNRGLSRRIAHGFQGHLEFRHRFTADEAWVASCPIVSRSTADAWLDRIAVEANARVAEIGFSERGFPLRIAEIGSRDSPLIYLQGGQHSMAERYGFFMMAAFFEAAAEDAGFLSRYRVAMLPIVNVDSPYVTGTATINNMNRLWGQGHVHAPTNAVERYLNRESQRTGLVAALDWHTGVIWPEHTLAISAGSSAEIHDALAAERCYFQLIDWSKNHPGMFGRWAGHKPGIRLAATVELALAVSRVEGGASPVTSEGLEEQGRRLFRALKRLIDGSRE